MVFSCKSLYNLTIDYTALPPEGQSVCIPYVGWKISFLSNVILYFFGMAFGIGTCETFLNKVDPEI